MLRWYGTIHLAPRIKKKVKLAPAELAPTHAYTLFPTFPASPIEMAANVKEMSNAELVAMADGAFLWL